MYHDNRDRLSACHTLLPNSNMRLVVCNFNCYINIYLSAKKPTWFVHSEPKRIENTFPLAMTFNMEPKEASVSKIRHYIQKHYPDCNTDHG